jgi:hypothetical protein
MHDLMLFTPTFGLSCSVKQGLLNSFQPHTEVAPAPAHFNAVTCRLLLFICNLC